MSDISEDELLEFKGKCKKNQSEGINPKIDAYLKSIGIDSQTSNPDYTLNIETINKGKSYQTDVFCLHSDTYNKDRMDTIKKNQEKLTKCKGNECWKHKIDGLGNIQINGKWNTCTTDINTMVNLIDDLKNKNNVKVKNNIANNCSIINGVPKYYRGINAKSQKEEVNTQKEPQKEIKITEIPKLPAKNVIGIIPDESTELFIPTDELSVEDASNITNVIDNDAFKEKKDMLVTYFTKKYDPDARKMVEDKHLLLKKCFRDGKNGFCTPVGLTENVSQLFNEKSITLNINDQRKLPEAHPFELNAVINVNGKESPLIIRDYQQKVIDEAQIKGRGIIEIATGGGKTLVATGIISKIGQDTVFVVPNNSLFYNAKKQIGDYLDKNKVNIGQVGGMNVDYKDDPNKTDINIVSLPLAALAISSPNRIDPMKREVVLKALKNAKIIIFDETHHISADTYKKVSDYSPAKYRFGLSATPFRDDGKTLEIVAGVGKTLGSKIRAKTLIDKGYLTPPEIYVINNNDIDPMTDASILENLSHDTCNINPKTTMWKNVKEGNRLPSRYNSEKKQLFRYIEKASVECNKKRNERVTGLVQKLDDYDKTKVVFVNSVEHGKKLQNMLEKQGIYSELLTGDTESKILKNVESEEEISEENEDDEEKEKEYNKKRSILFEKMSKGDLKTIIATDKIMGEGVDIPAIDSLILTDMRKSKVSAMQMVGRALRKKEGKEKALIFDFNDPVEYLHDWMKERHNVWETEEYPIKFIEYGDVDQKLETSLGLKSTDTLKRKENDLKLIKNKALQHEYEDLKILDLKKVAKDKGLKITGLNKQEIVSKLMNIV
ncbi:MAG: DEAD/DEAH box helicase [Acidithiobacillus sp.]|jgi:superfamily II DNA or RNA helicase|uniref:DEAD/DEAH box helicase n=1 Tax=Acidithiobacillus sp. TaxID=1872118 RepID=UPI00355E9CE7